MATSGCGTQTIGGPPSEVWAKSLRRETALQEHYRSAIHHGSDRWDAARCLQEQVDSARGVEYTRRLIKSRAITARFARRSVMKDRQGTELQTPAVFSGTKSNKARDTLSDEDGSPTRCQALEKFGIDLGHVGVLTSARTASRQSLAEDGSGGGQVTACDCATGIRRRSGLEGHRATAISASQNTGNQRDRGGELKTTKGTRGDSVPKSKWLAAKRQQKIFKKLKALDQLFDNELACPLPSGEDQPKREEGEIRSAVSKEDESSVFPAENETEYRTTDTSSIEPLREELAENMARVYDNVVLPEPVKARTVAGTHAPHGEEAGGGAKVVIDVEQSRLIGKALPNHKPCWWAFCLLLDAEGVCIPDMVFSAWKPEPSSSKTPGTGPVAAAAVSAMNQNNKRKASTRMGLFEDAATITPTSSTRNPQHVASTSPQHRHQRLLWVSSKAAEDEAGGGGNMYEHGPSPRPCAGVASSAETEGSGGGTMAASPSMAMCGQGLKPDSSRISKLSVEPVPRQLHTQSIDDNQGLLRAARAICECGRRGGGGPRAGKVEGVGGVSTLQLPLAVLKIWCRESDEERGRQSRSSSCGKLETLCRGRRMRVVSLWTEAEVIGALRDMARGRWCRPNRRRYTHSYTQSYLSPPILDAPRTRTRRKGVQSEELSRSFANDEDACCVLAFTKSARFAEVTQSIPSEFSFKTSHTNIAPSCHFIDGSIDTTCGNPIAAEDEGVDASTGNLTDVGQDGECAGNSSSTYREIDLCFGDGVGILTPRNDVSNRGRRQREPAASPANTGLRGPVFYRAAWRRTGQKLFVWKITSRYPYVSRLSAHFSPLVRVGSAAPFTASQAEEGAISVAASKMEKLAKVLRKSFDPTLQQLWADWAINEHDGRWLLIEVHGIKTDADIRNAAAARAAPPAFSEVEPKVCTRRIPPRHFCGDPSNLQARISAATPTQEISLLEASKRVASATAKRKTSRPPTPSKVAETTKKALQAQREAASKRKQRGDHGRGRRQMRNQYWRCAGDFCETRSCRAAQRSPTKGKDDVPKAAPSALAGTSAEGVRAHNSRNAMVRFGAEAADDEGEVEAAERDCEVEDIIGRRKHALAVEVPRTALFRLVLNARVALLGWRPSASEFSQMEKPVQLCSTCFSICDTFERERIETTRRAIDSSELAAREWKEKRNRRPPGWKSRVQHELESSLDADRDVVFRLMHSFEAASAANRGGIMKRTPPSAIPWQPSPPEMMTGGGKSVGGGRPEAHRNGEKLGAHLGVSNSKIVPAGGVVSLKTPTAEAASGSNPAPLAGSSGLGLASVQGENGATRSSLSGVSGKRGHAEEGEKQKQRRERQKREVRARRKTKERARRRLRRAATDDVCSYGEGGTGTSWRTSTANAESRGGKGQVLGNPNDQTRVLQDKLQPPLRPTAPTLPPPACDASLEEINGHQQHYQPDHLLEELKPTAPEGHSADENEEESQDWQGSSRERISADSSAYMESDHCGQVIKDAARQTLLKPIAPREKWGGREINTVPDLQEDDNGIEPFAVGRGGPKSDYEEEGFEVPNSDYEDGDFEVPNSDYEDEDFAVPKSDYEDEDFEEDAT